MVKNRVISPTVGKFVIFILLFIGLIGMISYGIYLYSYIESTKVNELETTTSTMIESGQIDAVTEMYHFQDEETYHILIGQDKEKKEKILFISMDTEHDDIIVIDRDKTLSNEEIKKTILQECRDCNIINTTPAMVDNKPLWEITYFDDKNRYVIDYLSMYDGTRFEQLRMYRKYKEKG